MKKIKKHGFIISLLILVACSSAKNIGSEQREGRSVEKAIVVGSIPEEYEYVRKVCIGCQLLEQSLIFEDGKPFDVLRLKQPNGEEISYYFDISKFYGKGF